MSINEKEITSACMDVMDRFMEALNRHDAAGMNAAMHFPHVRHAEGKVKVYDAADSNPMDLFARLKAEDNWSSSIWLERKLIQCNEVKAHFMVSYTRFRSDGSVIGSPESLYVLTKIDGRWGVQIRSSFGA